MKLQTRKLYKWSSGTPTCVSLPVCQSVRPFVPPSALARLPLSPVCPLPLVRCLSVCPFVCPFVPPPTLAYFTLSLVWPSPVGLLVCQCVRSFVPWSFRPLSLASPCLLSGPLPLVCLAVTVSVRAPAQPSVCPSWSASPWFRSRAPHSRHLARAVGPRCRSVSGTACRGAPRAARPTPDCGCPAGKDLLLTPGGGVGQLQRARCRRRRCSNKGSTAPVAPEAPAGSR